MIFANPTRGRSEDDLPREGNRDAMETSGISTSCPHEQALERREAESITRSLASGNVVKLLTIPR